MHCSIIIVTTSGYKVLHVISHVGIPEKQNFHYLKGTLIWLPGSHLKCSNIFIIIYLVSKLIYSIQAQISISVQTVGGGDEFRGAQKILTAPIALSHFATKKT